jgi:hypothetical protein
MGIFGWSLPPGCSHRDIERAAGGDGPCEVCGDMVDDCICPECPECPECGTFGDPKCYAGHGLAMTEKQKLSLAWNEAIWEDDARAQERGVEEYLKEDY